MKILDAGDRIHVATRRVEWTILRGFQAGRGPGSIGDVRLRARPWTQLVTDGAASGHTINDPLGGGLAGVGLVACLPRDGHGPNPDTFWDEAWELTTRLDSAGGGYGVTGAQVDADGAQVRASCTLQAAGQALLEISWLYTFDHDADDQVELELELQPRPIDGLQIKEPKVVFNGLRGYRQLTVTDQAGKVLRRDELERHGNPRSHTIQIGDPARRGFRLEAADRPAFALELDNTLAEWARQADQAPAMSPNAIRADGTFGPAAGYCLTPTGHLKQQTEIPRWADADVAGIAIHAWEGGYGAPDCWNAFRPVTLTPQTINATITIGD